MSDVKIDYIEFHSKDLDATKAFFSKAFGWGFTDYGPDYCDFKGQGVDGGFFRSEDMALASAGAPRVIFYSANLEKTQAKIETANGVICREIQSFPGGRRFHFLEPGGNELGVWSDVTADDKKIA
ncbi:MAG TPA: VOC family protein [Rhodobacteraceae bacterium]|nr:VOC family protein [Paracoccaceae bacterium]